MRSLKSFICLLSLMMGLGACSSDKEETAPSANVQVTTGSTRDVGMTTATLLGTVSGTASSYAEIGIGYCLENSGSDMTYVRATNIETNSGNSSFSVTVSGLTPDAAYIYSAYVKDSEGTLITAKEQKGFRTSSPAELLQYNAVQWVALRDATLCWDLSDSEIYKEMEDNRFQVSFGIAWSTENDQVIPHNNQFSASTKVVNFGQEPKVMVKLTALSPATTYYYSTFVNLNGALFAASPSSFMTIAESAIRGTAPSGVEAVDLGLPSGTRWASVNLGATSATAAGLFYAWGETDGYLPDGSDGHTFNWSNYKWCNGSRESQGKYCTTSEYGTVDNKVILDLADDAAYINWGDEWRTPTSEEVSELFDNTSSVWTTLDGVVGYRFTSKTTGNTIFLPAVGCRVSESHYDEGQNGYYWSASIDQPSPYASRYLGFKADKVFPASLHRYYGMNIRPVRR